jgi:hypothetical protein
VGKWCHAVDEATLRARLAGGQSGAGEVTKTKPSREAA